MLPILITGTLAAFSLSVAVVIGIRSRNIFAPKLRLSLGYAENVPKPKKFSPRINIIAMSSSAGAEFNCFFHVHVKNESKRKISDVIVELNYPEEFCLRTSDILKSVQEFRGSGIQPRDIDDGDRVADLMGRREQMNFGGMCRSRYDFGTLRPGESISFFEPIRIGGSKREIKFVSNTIFERIRELLTVDRRIQAAFRVSASVLCDLSPPSRKAIDVIVATAVREDLESLLKDAVCKAYWLNDMPGGRTYFRPSTIFFEKFIPKITDKWSVVINLLPVNFKSKASDGQVAVAAYHDAEDEEIVSAEMIMPGFDIYNRRYDGLSTDMLAKTIGYIRLR